MELGTEGDESRRSSLWSHERPVSHCLAFSESGTWPHGPVVPSIGIALFSPLLSPVFLALLQCSVHRGIVPVRTRPRDSSVLILHRFHYASQSYLAFHIVAFSRLCCFAVLLQCPIHDETASIYLLLSHYTLWFCHSIKYSINVECIYTFPLSFCWYILYFNKSWGSRGCLFHFEFAIKYFILKQLWTQDQNNSTTDHS